jgi:hypothetical protein
MNTWLAVDMPGAELVAHHLSVANAVEAENRSARSYASARSSARPDSIKNTMPSDNSSKRGHATRAKLP